MTECNICVEKYSKSKNGRHSKITCLHCTFECCKTCWKVYILGQSSYPKCMNTECEKEFTPNFLVDNFSYTWYNTAYKKHREEILFNHEKSKFVEIYPIIEKRNKVDEINNEIREIRDEINHLKSLIYQKEINIRNITFSKSEDEPKHTFFGNCPKDCNGTINSSWKCIACDTKVCKSCKEEDHEDDCDPEILANVKKLKSECKPCPNCKIPVFRISGCSDMYCTQCHTGFSWRTGEILNLNRMHNPHLTEWRRQNRQEGNMGCDRRNEISIRLSNRKITLEDTRIITYNYISNKITNFLQHVRYVVMRPNINELKDRLNLETKISFIKNEISEDKFKMEIRKIDKKISKKTDYRQIFEMFVEASIYLIHTVKNNEINEKRFVENFIELINYTNKSFADLYKIYKNVFPQIFLNGDHNGSIIKVTKPIDNITFDIFIKNFLRRN